MIVCFNYFLINIKEFEIEDDIDEDECDSPKYLADIFESVAGAIYLDSGCSLKAVWKVYYKMLAPYFGMSKYFSSQSKRLFI